MFVITNIYFYHHHSHCHRYHRHHLYHQYFLHRERVIQISCRLWASAKQMAWTPPHKWDWLSTMSGKESQTQARSLDKPLWVILIGLNWVGLGLFGLVLGRLFGLFCIAWVKLSCVVWVELFVKSCKGKVKLSFLHWLDYWQCFVWAELLEICCLTCLLMRLVCFLFVYKLFH